MKYITIIVLILAGGLIMSLHDISRGDSERIAKPTASFTDVQPNDLRMAHGTNQVHHTEDGTETSRLAIKERQLLAVQNGVNKAVYGFDPTDGKFGLKVAQDGVDVTTASDDELIFNYNQNMFKIVQSGTASITLTNASNTVASGIQTQTISHNLGFKPAFFVWMTKPSTSPVGENLVMLPDTTFFNDTPIDGVFTYFQATVDNSNLYIKYNHNSSTDYSPSAPTFTVRYYLMVETSAT